MECLGFDDMSPVDLIAGLGVNPGCTPIKFSHLAKNEQVFEAYEKNASPYILKTTCLHTVSSTQPSILRRGKHRQYGGTTTSEERLEDSHELDEESFDEVTCIDLVPMTQPGQVQPLPTTPVRLPFENLPFSPSQFMNSSYQLSSDKMTSTPAMSQSSHCTGSISRLEPLTPRNHQVALQSFSPHTPTPFKHALAEVERRAQSKPWSPSDLDDLGEVLKQCDCGFMADHNGCEADHNGCEADHMGYEADHSSGFTPVSQMQQSKRKFCKETQRQEKKMQKKSAKKIIFIDSPPKDATHTVTLDPAYQKVACGLTKDQLDMTQLAKSYYF